MKKIFFLMTILFTFVPAIASLKLSNKNEKTINLNESFNIRDSFKEKGNSGKYLKIFHTLP